jgi:hypothetical protein
MVLVRGHYKIMEMKRRRKGEKKKEFNRKYPTPCYEFL